MVIFHSYVSLPEDTLIYGNHRFYHNSGVHPNFWTSLSGFKAVQKGNPAEGRRERLSHEMKPATSQ